MDNAGASAQREYERRLINHRRRVWKAVPRLVIVALFLGAVAWVVSEQFLPGNGALMAFLIAVSFVLQGIPSRQPADAWGIGAIGERKTAKALSRLDSNYRILHDRKIRGRKSNIDHIVIGPTGIFAIETKNVKGRVTLQGGHLMVGGRKRDDYVEEVWREAVAVQEVLAPVMASLGQSVGPIICFHRAELPWGKTSVQSVRVVGARGLRKIIGKGPVVLTATQVESVAALCDHALKQA